MNFTISITEMPLYLVGSEAANGSIDLGEAYKPLD
jgi:hypothetical protein